MSQTGTGKRWVFRLFTVALIAFAGAFGAEALLQWRQTRIARSDALDPGMIQYDDVLGWKLTPGWSGGHRHHDYSARYSINALGFRNDAPVLVGAARSKPTLVVGDSFTFGLGVNDDETFVHRLNESKPSGVSFSNAAVPGYSTDQEALLIAHRLPALKPDRIVLVVYLGNDFFDNLLAFPLQVSSPKPYFEWNGGALVLRNNPVPQGRKPREAGLGGLVAAVWGADPARWPLRIRLGQSSEVWRIFAERALPGSDHRGEMAGRFAPALQLFDHILERIADDCARNRVELTVVTLAGRSFVDRPDSVSAQYQDVFREQVLVSSRGRQLTVVDLAGLMQERYRREGGKWFFPNEGHLNAAGHRVVAEILQRELALP